MTLTKKNIKVWEAAALHTFIAAIIIPIVILGIYTNIALHLGVTALRLNKDFIFQLSAEIIQVLAIWVGVKISAYLIIKRYVISLPKKVIFLSTLYVTIFLLLGFALSFIQWSTFSNISLPVFFIFLIGTPLSVLVFNVESRLKLVNS
jgi:hypothetical protein